MRLQHTFISLLFALTCAERIRGGDGSRLRLRQEHTDITSATSSAPSSTAASSHQSVTPSQTASDVTGPSASGTTTSQSPSTESLSGDVTVPITTTGTAAATATSTLTLPGSSNATYDGVTLPLQPTLNPAIGIAGVVLMISGLVLGFVGIKHRGTQTFLSTALLIGLSIEVLVIYLMHPPVPVAIQGAYLIAGVGGGCLLGGLALVFKEVSEGFGCILGGFCLAMWLLVLRPGGLIQNSAGKIILIAVLCAAGYSSYISRFTRVYGVIICTSIAGATAFILGVDCFSQAGLKEFWLYIWDLNDNEFPLFTNTYPITRNMRVEIACIIIVAFLGTMSQIKIWKIVKEQKAKRDAQRIQDEEARDAEEEEVGRNVETQNRRSLAHWEGHYDGKKHAEVSVASGTASFDEFGKDMDVESSKTRSYPMVNVRRVSGQPQSNSSSEQLISPSAKRFTLPPFEFDEDAETNGGSTRNHSSHGKSTYELSQAEVTSYHGTATEVTTPATEPVSPGLHVPDSSMTERRGVGVKRLSMLSLQAKDAMEEPISPFVDDDDDLASSVAATAAEPPDVDALSTRLSRPNSMYLSHGAARNSTLILQLNEEVIDDDDEEALYSGRKTSASSRPPQSPQTPSMKSQGGDSYFGDAAKTVTSDRLPKKASKAALTHRTNEWAKEVSRAEPEPIEDVLVQDDEAVHVEMGNAADSARAEQNNAAPPPPPPPLPRQPKPTVERKQSKNVSRPPSALGLQATPVYAHQHATSSDSWSIPLAQRTNSIPTLAVQQEEPLIDRARNSSTPMLDQPLVQSPVEQSPNKRSQTPQLTRRDSSNLLDERKERMENRLTTTSFMTPNTIARRTPEGTRPDETIPEDNEDESAPTPNFNRDEEDMTLAERKALVQSQVINASDDTVQPLASLNRVSQASIQMQFPSAPKPARMSSMIAAQPIYDSHQPRRTSSHNVQKQANNWNAWRSSNATATNSRQNALTSDSQMDMLRAARRQSETEARQREQQRQAKQDQMDAHMRMGGMNNVHRAALARMQGEANKKGL